MNAVTTAEYVVLEQIDPNTFQQEINAHSKAGYKMVSTHVIFDDSNHAVLYNAVMVREPLNAAIASDFIGHFMVLATRVEALEGRLNAINHRLDGIEKDVNGTDGLVPTQNNLDIRTAEFSQAVANLSTEVGNFKARVEWLESQAHAHSPGGTFGVTK